MTPKEIGKIKYGDYLEIKHKLLIEEGIVYGKVISVSDPGLIYLDRKVIWIPIYPQLDLTDKINWDYEYLTKYVNRLVDGYGEKRLIKLLYDS